MTTFKNKLMASGAAFGLLMSLGTVAAAQEDDGERKFKRFDEIIVTARKREENIQETPLSISAFTANMIEAAGIRDMADIAKATPGFSLDDKLTAQAAYVQLFVGKQPFLVRPASQPLLTAFCSMVLFWIMIYQTLSALR